jgi:uncharacterized delta-60 repeat protein
MSLMSQNGQAAGITISAVASVDEGSPYTLDLSPSGDDAADITGWQINWGDGHVDNITGHPATATHHYADGPADYRISATATDGTNSLGSDGTLDASFFDGGVRSTEVAGFPYSTEAAILPDGNVVMLDSWGLQTTNGATVNLWSYFGYMPGTEKIAAQADGKILVSGVGKDGKMNVVRFLENGNLDTSFGANHDGIASTAFDAFLNYYNGDYGYTIYGWNSASLAVAQDGSFVVSSSLTGTDVSLQHFSADGILDTDFGGNENGIATADLSDSSYWNNVENRVFITPDGQILAGGNFYDSYYYMSTWRFAEFDAGGSRDTSAFGGSGVWTVGSSIKDMAFLSDGSIIATDGSAVTHYVDGTQDMSFGSGGCISGSAIAVQADGKFLVLSSVSDGYTSTLYLDRYNADLTPDAYFGSNGRVETTLGYDDGLQIPLAMALQADGKVLIASYEYAYGYPCDGNLLVGRFDSGLAVHVDNAAPALSVASSISVNVGQTVDLTSLATFTDPGFDDSEGLPPTSEYFTYTITWGDEQSDEDMWVGSVTSGSAGVLSQGAVDAQHVYGDPGTYHASLTVTDDDGGTDTVDFDVTVAEPVVSIAGANTISLGADYTLSFGDVTNPGGAPVRAYTVHWGDGTTNVCTAEEIAQNHQVAHVYGTAPGSRSVTVDMTDDSGTYADVADAMTVDVNPFMADINVLHLQAGLSDIIPIANFGQTPDLGGLALSVPLDITDQVFSWNEGSAGVVSWQPNCNSQLGEYTVVATASYNGHSWTKTLTFDVSAEDNMPPIFDMSSDWLAHCEAFPEHDGSADYYAWVSAHANNGQTIEYSLSGDYPEGATMDPESGLFSYHLTEDDAFQIYTFDVKATASGGSDTMHVVFAPTIRWVGQATAIADGHVLTAVDATDGPQFSASRVIDGGPSHGSLAPVLDENGDPTGYVRYVPEAGFQGLDKFSYHLEYDLYDAYGDLVEENASTNTATEYIQVGPFCSIDTGGMKEVDGKCVVKAGQTTTVTVTLDNPRGDGCAVTGIWSLSYNADVIRVTGGGNCLPGQTNLVKGLTSSQTITLTVEGITGGVSDLGVGWGVFTNPEAATTAGQFTIGSSAGVGIACYGVGVTISPAGDVNTNPLLQKEVTTTDSSVSATLVQLETLNVHAGVNIPGNPSAYETYQITFHCGGGRLWADAYRGTPIPTDEPLAMTNPDAAFTIYVESVSGGSTEVSVDLVSTDSAIAEKYDNGNGAYTVNWGWVNGSLQPLEQKVAQAAKSVTVSQTEAALKANVFDPLRTRLDEQIGLLDPTDPNQKREIEYCNKAKKALDDYRKDAAEAVGNIAFDAVQFSFNFLLPTTAGEQHPTNEALKRTVGNSNPGIEYPSLKFAYEWNVNYSGLINDIVAGNQTALKNWCLDPKNYLKSIGLQADLKFGSDVQAKLAFGIREIKDLTDFRQNTYYGNLSAWGTIWDKHFTSFVGADYTPDTHLWVPGANFQWTY